MHTEYRQALAEFEANQQVRVIVVTGHGRSFCVGGDAQALQGHSDKGGYDPGTPDPLATPDLASARILMRHLRFTSA
jgi:enoyl-CoA hydratase/carnithine racemase